MKKIVFTWALLLLGFSATAQHTENLLNNYISIKDALVSGDSKMASQATSTLYQSLKNEENFEEKTELLKAVEKLNKANDIEKQRTVFNDVSTVMWKLIKRADKIDQPVYYEYCPMKKAYWLSKDKEIRNPYYGSSMLTCGKVTETKE